MISDPEPKSWVINKTRLKSAARKVTSNPLVFSFPLINSSNQARKKVETQHRSLGKKV